MSNSAEGMAGPLVMPSDLQLCTRATPEKTGITLNTGCFPVPFITGLVELLPGLLPTCAATPFSLIVAISSSTLEPALAWTFGSIKSLVSIWHCILQYMLQTWIQGITKEWVLSEISLLRCCAWVLLVMPGSMAVHRTRLISWVVSVLTWPSFYRFARKMYFLGRTEMCMKALLYENRRKLFALCILTYVLPTVLPPVKVNEFFLSSTVIKSPFCKIKPLKVHRS